MGHKLWFADSCLVKEIRTIRTEAIGRGITKEKFLKAAKEIITDKNQNVCVAYQISEMVLIL